MAGNMADEPVERAPEQAGEEETDDGDKLSTAMSSFDLLADEAAGSGLVAALVWVFALDWISGYDTSVFMDPFTTPNEYGKKAHCAFVVFIALTVGMGGFGVLVLTFYYNVMKLASFSVQKTGNLTKGGVRAAAETVVSLDKMTYIGRFLGVAFAFPCFMLSALIYLWYKVKHNSSMTEDAAKNQAIAVTVIITVFLAASFGCFIWIAVKYKGFKERVTGQAEAFAEQDAGKAWYHHAFKE
eukprot:Hpha_TRINITY_DN14456_c1_g1::TRINITY_DN14456_c1_g1_i1::g.157196::m.157196